jgi:hypothetical protein
VRGKQIVVGVTPSHAIRDVLGRAAAWLDPDVVVVNASKGLEDGTLQTIDQVYADIFPARIAARATFLSGPTFAAEIAGGMPSAIVLAGRDPETTAMVQRALSTDRFRTYSTDDVVGVLVGGAIKNVIAIAAGVSDGLGFGSNARAALITRGLAEITRIGVAMGAEAGDLRRPVGDGRSGADLLERHLAQPQGRPRARPRPDHGRDPRRHAHGRRGRQDHQGRVGPRAQARRAGADHRGDARDRPRGCAGPRRHAAADAAVAAQRGSQASPMPSASPSLCIGSLRRGHRSQRSPRWSPSRSR